MMEETFERKRRLNTFNLEAAFKRRSSITGFVHFDEKKPFDFATSYIPFLENCAFVLALFNHKTQEGFEEGTQLLNKLLAYVQEASCPKYLHEFPEISDPYNGMKAYPYLFKIQKHFAAYLPQGVKKALNSTIEKIGNSFLEKDLYPSLKILKEAIEGRYAQVVDLSHEAAFALSFYPEIEVEVPYFDQKLKSIVPPWAIWERGHPKLSLVQFILADQLGQYSHELFEDHPLHLLLSLFYEPFDRKKPILKGVKGEEFCHKVWIFRNKDEVLETWSFDHKEGVECHISQDVMKLAGALALHDGFHLYIPKNYEVTQFGKKGTYFLKNEPIYLESNGTQFKLIASQNMSLGMAVCPGEIFGTYSRTLGIKTSGSFSLTLEKV